MELDALRYKYRILDASNIVISHQNLGIYLRRHARQPHAALAHHLAAALISVLTGSDEPVSSLIAAGRDLKSLGDDASTPADIADLCRQVSEVPGVDLARLLTALGASRELAEQAYQEVTARVQAAAAAPPAPPSRHLASWDPVIAALLAARGGDTQAAAALDEELAQYSDSPDWAALAAALARIHDGETSPSLLDGLDQIDTAITTRALNALADRTTIPLELWPAIPLGQLMGDLVAAALGDSAAAARAGQTLDKLAGDPDHARLTAALRRILGGDHAPVVAAQLAGATDKAIVATILTHITASQPEPT